MQKSGKKTRKQSLTESPVVLQYQCKQFIVFAYAKSCKSISHTQKWKKAFSMRKNPIELYIVSMNLSIKWKKHKRNSTFEKSIENHDSSL